MTYFPMGFGAIDATHFNSTKYPGICKPMDKPTMDQVVEMQKQLNRLAQLKAVIKIAPDGDVGPATVALVNTVKDIVLPFDTDVSCISVGMAADQIANNAKMAADAAGVPDTVSAPTPPKPPSYIAPTGVEVTPPPESGIAASLSSALGGMDTTTMILLGIGVLGIGYIATRKKGRK